MIKVNYAEMGKKIQIQRNRMNLTQERLAGMINLSQKQISNIERAASIPTLQTFVNICNALNVPPNVLLMESIETDYPERFAEMVAVLEDCSMKQVEDINKYISYVLNCSP